jgi:hypothetical protein
MAGSQKRAYVITDNQRALNASWDRPNSCPLQNPKDDTEAISTEEQAFGRGSAPGRRLVVLSVADMRAPGGALPLLARFRQRQMREQAIGRGPVPVHRIRRDIDRIPGAEHLRLLTLEANAADAGQTEERLPHRVGVPRCARAGS